MGRQAAAVAAPLLAMLAMPRSTSAALQKADSRPVMKVVRLLEDMRVELAKELEDDKAVHETLDCWCKTNNREKSQAIEIGEGRSSQLESTMSEALAKIQELKEKRKAVMEELNADIASVQQADTLRMKENKAFHDVETDMLAAIQSIKQAVVVLAKHNRADFAQMQSVAHSLQSAKVPQLALSAKILAPDQVAVLKNFLSQADSHATGSSFLAVPGYEAHAAQSGEIFGVLKQMQEEFEADLAEKQKAEEQAVADYEDLKKAKESEIATGKKTQTEIDSDLAMFSEKHALAAKELEETKAQLELDREFLATLEKKCAQSDEEFDARLKSRMEEISAVEDTIKILNSDAAFQNFGKTVSDPDTANFVAQSASSFLQVSSNEDASRQQRALTALRKLAYSTKSPKVALIADAVKLDSFKEVKEMIDKMIAELGKQQSDEVAHRDLCKDDMAQNDRDTSKATDHKEKLETTIADLEKTIKTLTEDMAASQKEVDEMNLQMKRASETREGENAEFQTTVTDQRMTQAILQKAMDRMMEVFAATELKTRKLTQGSMLQEDDDQPGAPHIQTSGTHTDPGNGPARFDEYEQNAGGKRVIALLEEVMTDSKKTEDEAIRGETDAQQFYENFMQDSNKSIKEHLEAISSMSEAKAKAEMDLGMHKTDLKATDTELENLAGLMGDLHKSCDFILNNFEARQEARAAEQDALREAKSILSGEK